MNMYNNLPQQTPGYMYGYNIPQYQRMMNMGAAQEPQAAQPIQSAPSYMTPQQNYIKGRPVVSIDEARASQIDLDGSLYVFPDLGNKKIYTKQINMDGTATFNTFELVAPAPMEGAQSQAYVTKAELDEILTQFKVSLEQNKTPESATAPKIKAQINQPFNL